MYVCTAPLCSKNKPYDFKINKMRKKTAFRIDTAWNMRLIKRLLIWPYTKALMELSGLNLS